MKHIQVPVSPADYEEAQSLLGNRRGLLARMMGRKFTEVLTDLRQNAKPVTVNLAINYVHPNSRNNPRSPNP